MITIRTHRRQYHYFRDYVLSDFDSSVLVRARAEIGDRGLQRIAQWLHCPPADLVAVVRKEAM
jgi:hypothetical protein